MPRTCRICVADLRGILFSVFDRHGDDVDIYMNLGGGLAALADHLNHITSNLDVSDNLDAMAYIMAMVTMKVNTDAPIGYSMEAAQEIDALTWKVRTEFSLECAIFFAQLHGYQISASDVPSDQVARLLLLMPDTWEQLVRVFEEALLAASFNPGLDGADPGPTAQGFHGGGAVDRYLSTESYSNLRSEADQRHWTDAEVLMLIDEHLRPHLDPLAVHYSETVSSEEWLSLHNWLRGQDKQLLCRATVRSSRTLFPSPSVISHSRRLILRPLRIMSE